MFILDHIVGGFIIHDQLVLLLESVAKQHIMVWEHGGKKIKHSIIKKQKRKKKKKGSEFHNPPQEHASNDLTISH